MKVKHEGRVYWRDGDRWVYECTLFGRSAPIIERDPNTVALLNAMAANKDRLLALLRGVGRDLIVFGGLMLAMGALAATVERHFERQRAAEARPR